VGLAISYTLQIFGVFAPFFSMSADLETKMVSVARLLEYTQLKSESASLHLKRSGLYANAGVRRWPRNGEIRFNEARVSYIPGKDVLRGITCTIFPQEKVSTSFVVHP